MPIRPGVAPIAWSNDDLPEPGGDTPLLRLGSGGSRTGSAKANPLQYSRMGREHLLQALDAAGMEIEV